MIKKMQATAQKVLKLANNQGVEQAEVFLLDSRNLTIEVTQQEVENLKLAEERGLGLRVISRNRLGYAYSSDLTEQALEKTVERAIYNSRAAVAEPAWQLAGIQKDYRNLKIYDETIFLKPVEEKINLAMELEQAALAYDPYVNW